MQENKSTKYCLKCRYALKLNARTQDKERERFKNHGDRYRSAHKVTNQVTGSARESDKASCTKHHKQEDHTRPGYYERNKTKLVSAKINTKQITMNAVIVKAN